MTEAEFVLLINKRDLEHQALSAGCQRCGEHGDCDYTHRIALARAFAKMKHNRQLWAGFPYSEHIFRVAALVAENTCDPEVICAAWMHDTIEDQGVKRTEIETLLEPYGVKAARLVQTVSNGPGKNRAEKHRNTYPGIAKDKDATLIKICDRIINVEVSTGTELHKMYRKENDYFQQVLRTGSDFEHLWVRLDRALQ